MTPDQEMSEAFGRDVRMILRREEVGIRWADQISALVTFEYLDGNAPYRVDIGERERPLSVVVLSAMSAADNTISSMCRIEWRWLPARFGAGLIQVDAIDVPSTSVVYDVTLGILRS